MHYKKLLLYTLIFVLPFTAFSQNDWELKKDSEGIKVWWRAAAVSDIREIKMKMEVEASLNSIVALMADIESYTEWVYATEQTRIMEDLGNNTTYYYNVIDFPWPMDDRDLILYSTVEQDAETKVITAVYKAAPEKMEEDEDMIRVQMTDIEWIITPLDTNRASIDYRLISDPGGSIPAWLINIASDFGPFKTMQSFKKHIKLSKYQEVNVEGIEELFNKQKQ